ncbi:hypothetical protein [Paraburkholderia unamae]|uniref:DKNYY family protein n=1 Tax=Paraburkholderia unamae TaxID=219649 RepID=A0ABX5K8Z2_9BURK|nr:hypothetical protein [Paraburkholderia unamae]PVX71064.1 hypothetical protein C7402_13128 [Paraburkholderia unamae]CAG9247007.1 exported hypothetical protein [Paraburkholderia unamae]
MGHIFRVVLLASLFACTYGVNACTIRDYTWYFGYLEDIGDHDFELDQAVANDIKRAKTIVFEDGPTLQEHHLFYLRRGVLYVKGEPVESVDGSFRYLGNGYFRLHGMLYYRGVAEAFYSPGTVIKTWNEAREDPPPPARADGVPILYPCGRPTYPWFVLETSDGLHLEHKESFGFSSFPYGITCKSITGRSCEDLGRQGHNFKPKGYYEVLRPKTNRWGDRISRVINEVLAVMELGVAYSVVQLVKRSGSTDHAAHCARHRGAENHTL